MSTLHRFARRSTRWPVALVALLTLALLPALITPAHASHQNSLVFPPEANPYGQSLGDWNAAWWDWVDDYPFAVSPATDDGVVTHGDADEQPEGPVWYLAGTFGGPGERWLEVPVGKSLLTPLINWDVWSPEDCWWMGASEEPDACSAEDLQAFLDDFFENSVTGLSLTIDGEAIDGLFDYRATSGAFTLDINPDSLWTDLGYTTGPRYPNLADGYYVMVKPLAPGEHTIHFTASVGEETWQDMTYHLTVTN